MGEDACMTYPCLLECQTVLCINDCLYNYRINPNSMTKSRKTGYSWDTTRTKVGYYSKVLPLEKYDLNNQLCRFITHGLFNISKSWLQTDMKYRDIKKEIKKQLSSPSFQPYINNCKFKHNFKESLAAFLVKHKLVFGIKLIAIYEKSIISKRRK